MLIVEIELIDLARVEIANLVPVLRGFEECLDGFFLLTGFVKSDALLFQILLSFHERGPLVRYILIKGNAKQKKMGKKSAEEGAFLLFRAASIPPILI